MNSQQIRRVLLTDWDPLNVADSPKLADEYDRYIPGLMSLINKGASVPEIEQFLIGVEASFGIHPEPERSRRTAIRLASSLASLPREDR